MLHIKQFIIKYYQQSQYHSRVYAETRPPVIWAGKNHCGRAEIWGKKMKEQTKSPKTIDIVSYASKVSVNGVMCVFVVHFRSSDTF